MNCFNRNETNCDKTEENIIDLTQEEVVVDLTQEASTNMSSSVDFPQMIPTTCSRIPTNEPTHSTTQQYTIETIVNGYTSTESYYKDGGRRNFAEYNKRFAKDKRQWEDVGKTRKSSLDVHGISFIVMSYNILAQTLLENHSYLYRDIPKHLLDWESRWTKLTAEISQQNPDILCLQEVETSYLGIIGSFLNDRGYKGIFKQKTGTKVDGCAIFFKNNLFEVVDYLSVEYMQPGIMILNRDNVGMMVKLKSKSNPDINFVVCTTHLLYNPRRIDVRLAQMQLFLAEIDRFSFTKDLKTGKDDHLPIILTGDLNSYPDSPVAKLIDNGSVNVDGNFPHLYDIAITNACQHLEIYLERMENTTLKDAAMSMVYHSEFQTDSKQGLVNNKYSFDEYKHLFQNNFLRHNLKFTSAYDHVKPDGQREASTYHDEWVTADYIYYSSSNLGNLELLKRYRLPTSDECRDLGDIPNSFYGSDHFAIAAKFTLEVPKTHAVINTSSL